MRWTATASTEPTVQGFQGIARMGLVDRSQPRDPSPAGGHDHLFPCLGPPEQLGEPVLELAEGDVHGGG